MERQKQHLDFCEKCGSWAAHLTEDHDDFVSARRDPDHAQPFAPSGRSRAKQSELRSAWRYCVDCGGHKTPEWFPDKTSVLCTECEERRERSLRAANPVSDGNSYGDPHRAAVAARCAHYRMSVEDFLSLERAQSFCCAICKKRPRADRPLHVDHDHRTGRVRGLLCVSCNTGLGKLGDNLRRLKDAVDYLTEPPAERAGVEGLGPRKASPCL